MFRFTAHIVQTSLSHADPGSRDGTCVALYSNYLSGRPNNSRHQHRYVSDYKNVGTALAAGGAKLEHVIKWNVYIVQGQSVQPGFEAFRSAWGDRPNPPAVTVLLVAGLANPDFLVEIDAIAVVPQE